MFARKILQRVREILLNKDFVYREKEWVIVFPQYIFVGLFWIFLYITGNVWWIDELIYTLYVSYLFSCVTSHQIIKLHDSLIRNAKKILAERTDSWNRISREIRTLIRKLECNIYHSKFWFYLNAKDVWTNYIWLIVCKTNISPL